MKRFSLFQRFLTFVVLLLAMLACQLGGSTPNAGQPPAADTAAAVSTDTQSPPTPAVSQDFFTESFDTDSGLWSHFVVDASIQLTSPGSMPSLTSSDVGKMSVQT